MNVRTPTSSLRKRVMLAIAAPLLLLALLEGIFRGFGIGEAPEPRSFGNFSMGLAWTHLPEPAILRTHPTRLYEPQPNLRGIARTDERGFRGPDRPPHHEHLVRVAVLGDSTVFGFGVFYGDSFVGRTASELRSRFPAVDIDVVDAACYGYTSWQNRLDLDDRVLPLAPDVVVLCLAGFNDSVGALEMDDEAWTRVGPLRDSTLTRVARKSRLVQFIRNATDGAPSSHTASTPDSSQSPPPLRDGSEPLRRVSPQQYDANVRAMVARIRRSGATPVLMTHSFREDLLVEDPTRARYRVALETIAREENVELVNGAGALEDGAMRFYYDRIHPTEEGHERLATALVATLVRVCADAFTRRANPDAALLPVVSIADGTAPIPLAQLEPGSLRVRAETRDEASPRFFVGGSPVDDKTQQGDEYHLVLPPLPTGTHALELATRFGNAKLEDAVTVEGPRLSIEFEGERARIVVRAGADAFRFALQISSQPDDRAMMLRRRSALKEGTRIGNPLTAHMSFALDGSRIGVLEAPLGTALEEIPRLYLQALVEPDPERCRRDGVFGIVFPTNSIELGK